AVPPPAERRGPPKRTARGLRRSGRRCVSLIESVGGPPRRGMASGRTRGPGPPGPLVRAAAEAPCQVPHRRHLPRRSRAVVGVSYGGGCVVVQANCWKFLT